MSQRSIFFTKLLSDKLFLAHLESRNRFEGRWFTPESDVSNFALEELVIYWRRTCRFNAENLNEAKIFIFSVLRIGAKLNSAELDEAIGEHFLESLACEPRTAMLLYPEFPQTYKNLYDKYKIYVGG